MRKYGESNTTRIMMATVPHVISGSGLRKFQANGFLFDRLYIYVLRVSVYINDNISHFWITNIKTLSRRNQDNTSSQI